MAAIHIYAQHISTLYANFLTEAYHNNKKDENLSFYCLPTQYTLPSEQEVLTFKNMLKNTIITTFNEPYERIKKIQNINNNLPKEISNIIVQYDLEEPSLSMQLIVDNRPEKLLLEILDACNIPPQNAPHKYPLHALFPYKSSTRIALNYISQNLSILTLQR